MFIYKSKAIKVAGGTQAALARELGISRQAVSQWPDRQPIPQKHAMHLVKKYGEEPFR